MTILMSYADVMNKANTNEQFSDFLTEAIENFSTHGLNDDIEYFLKHRMTYYEDIGYARSYLVFDDDFIVLEGFFSISSRSLSIDRDVWVNLTRTQRGKISPFGKDDDSDMRSIPAQLLGQFGRNLNSTTGFSGADLMKAVRSVVQHLWFETGMRFLWLECANDPHLRSFYEREGFKLLGLYECIGDSDVLIYMRKISKDSF